MRWRGHKTAQATTDRSSSRSTSLACWTSRNECIPPFRTGHAEMSTGNIDTEAKTHHLSGYPSLAHFIASDRDRTTLIFKRYDELAARNLLYLQSELAELQAKQRAFDQEDSTANLSIKQCARNYSDFEKAVKANEAKQKDRWKLMKDIRETLKEYREALLFESTLATLPRPPKGVIRAFQIEYYNQSDGKREPFPILGGHSAGIYDDIDDLIALRVQDDQDRLTTFAQEHLAFLFPVSDPSLKARCFLDQCRMARRSMARPAHDLNQMCYR